MCIPEVALAVPPATINPLIADVVLRDGGVLLGQVVHSDGTPAAGVPVSLRSGNEQLVPNVTNERGYFAFSGLRTGTYQVVTPAGVGTYQAWNAQIAPPSAQPGALIVLAGDTVRGQHQPGPFANLFARPLLLGGLVAAAIAIPIAVANAQREPASP